MQEMRGADAFFLWMESRAGHMHTLKIVLVDPSTAQEELSFTRVRERAARLMPHFVAFRRRPVRMPGGLGHPLWLETTELDLDYHFRHVVLPPEAGEEALDELIGQAASEPLKEDRPLWQLIFVEGLPKGRVAYLTKIHHAVADGAAAAELIERLFQSTPGPLELPPALSIRSEAVPGASRRMLRALGRTLARQAELPGLVRRSLHALAVARAWRRAGTPMPPRPFAAPMTCFNQPLTPNRSFAHLTLPLPSIRRVKSSFGCTLNDVYLALVGGSLRSYLEGHGQLPSRPLTAAIPVSVRSKADDPCFGNAIGTWFASTGSDVADPVERLQRVARSTRAARDLFAASDPHLASEWLDHWALRRLYLRGLQALAGAVLCRPSFNVVVSNVRGPSEALYIDGSRVVALRSMGPLAPQQGLNFTAWSYQDDFAVGIHACREHVPDLPALAASFLPELERLEAAGAQLAAGAARDFGREALDFS